MYRESWYTGSHVGHSCCNCCDHWYVDKEIHVTLAKYVLLYIDPPQITEHPVGGDIPIGMNVTLNCNATGLGLLKFAWQRYDVGNWATISTDSTTSYTATASGLYRCRVSNEAGAVESNRTRVNIYGEYCIRHLVMHDDTSVHV